VHVIGIQPERTAIGDKLSRVVQKNGERVAGLIFDDRLDEISVLE
jgi:hypothetical protein